MLAGGWRDHPRIRGEHHFLSLPGSFSPGSSPHTRGALHRGLLLTHSTRIIPAYAGSTHDDVGQVQLGRDHPRIRGEHPLAIETAVAKTGSSPHTRGAQLRVVSLPVGVGIIPAYAGSTCVGPPGAAGPGDHPRIRGEHRKGGKSLTINKGSSPHTRGALGSTSPCGS